MQYRSILAYLVIEDEMKASQIALIGILSGAEHMAGGATEAKLALEERLHIVLGGDTQAYYARESRSDFRRDQQESRRRSGPLFEVKVALFLKNSAIGILRIRFNGD